MFLSHKQKRCQAGYTIVELMVAVALTGIVTTAIYKGYVSVSTAYDVQDQVVEVQQNARVAMDKMVRELRRAGCDPLQAGVGAVDPSSAIILSFTMDLAGGGTASDGIDNDGDGTTDEDDEDFVSDGVIADPGENITYSLVDSDGDGETDDLQRVDLFGATSTVIENVSAVSIVYYDANNVQTAVQADVRTVQIALVVRATNEDYGYTNNRDYSVDTLDGGTLAVLAAPNDNFRRQLLTAVVRCRNLGL